MEGEKLLDRMLITIEPIINAGERKIYQIEDGWTVKMIDEKLSAHYEHTIWVREYRTEVLTTFDF